MSAPPTLPTIYCEIGDVERFERAMAALGDQRTKESFAAAADACGRSVSTVRRWARLRDQLGRYALRLEGEGEAVPVAVFLSSKGFRAGCEKAWRVFPGLLKSLEPPGWVLSDGVSQLPVAALRHPDGFRG